MKHLPSEPTRLHELRSEDDPVSLARLVRSAGRAPADTLPPLKWRIRRTLRRRSARRSRYLRAAVLGGFIFLTGGVVGAVVQPILRLRQQPGPGAAEVTRPAAPAPRARTSRTWPARPAPTSEDLPAPETPPPVAELTAPPPAAPELTAPPRPLVERPPPAAPIASAAEVGSARAATPVSPRISAEPRRMALPPPSAARERRAAALPQVQPAPLLDGQRRSRDEALEPPRAPEQFPGWPPPARAVVATAPPPPPAAPLTVVRAAGWPPAAPWNPPALGRPTPHPSVAPLTPTAPARSAPAPSEQALLARALRTLRSEQRPESALATLDEYAVRFPNGTLLPEASRLRTEALLALGHKRAALAELKRDTGESSAGTEARHLVRAELEAAAGHWREALADFDTVVRARMTHAFAATTTTKASERFERALWGRASSRSQLGDDAGARADLREYLRQFPRGRFAAQASQLLGGLR